MLGDPRWELILDGDNLAAVSISASLSLSLETEGGDRCLILGPDDRDDPEYGVVPLCVVLGLLRAAGYQVRCPLDTEEPQPEATGDPMIYQPPPHSLHPPLSTIAWEVSLARLHRRRHDVGTMVVQHACRRSALPEIPDFLTVSTRFA